MEVSYAHVSAFTETSGGGNSAAVCRLKAWPDEAAMADLARAIGLPVTSIIVDAPRSMELRWLSRSGSFVQSMCGHGTLAAACVVAQAQPERDAFSFHTPGGEVLVRRSGGRFHLDLPRWNATPMPEGWPALNDALDAAPQVLLDAGRDVMAVFDSEDEVRALRPDMVRLLALGRRGFIATAPGRAYDCVSRFFCPSFGLGVDEDPVTGSAHCAIAPLWAQRLGKTQLRAFQASPVGGELLCEVSAKAVTIGASAVVWSHEKITI